MSRHSRFSPSHADAWMDCPGSIPLVESLIKAGTIVPFTGNVYTREGSAAGKLFERALKGDGVVRHAAAKIDGFAARPMVRPLQDMVDYVYSLKARMPASAVLQSEKWLPIACLGAGAGGTPDASLRSRKRLHIVDLKWGQGVVVHARENKQMGLYALGELQNMGPPDRGRIDKVTLHILQPRAQDEPSVWRAPFDWLDDLERRARVAIKAVESGNAKLNPSEKACQWCQAKAHCPALAAKAAETARVTFKEFIKPIAGEIVDKTTKSRQQLIAADVRALTTAQVGALLSHRRLVELWLSALEERVTIELDAGRKVPGWKRVEGRTQRTWRDERRTIAAFRTMKLGIDDYMPRKLIGITAAAELIPSKRREAFLSKLTSKPTGQPTIAPESDPRPAIANVRAQKVFKVQ